MSQGAIKLTQKNALDRVKCRLAIAREPSVALVETAADSDAYVTASFKFAEGATSLVGVSPLDAAAKVNLATLKK